MGPIMLKHFIACALLIATGTAAAQDTNLYDLFMSECMAIENDQVSCHRSVKQKVLTDPRTSGDYLECIDYGHSYRTIAQDAECLREISWLQ